MNLDLTPILNENKTFEIEKFDDIKNGIQEYINKLPLNIVISDATDLKAVKDSRTEVNKIEELIKKNRIASEKIIIGTFKNQCKEIETLLKGASDKLKELVDNYQNKIKEEIFKLEVKSTNKEIIEEVRKFAISKGCIVK